MNVKRIVVDELPSQCLRCKYFRVAYTTLQDMDFCNVADRYIDSDDIHTRPDWCPLVVEDNEVCEWKKHKNYSYFMNPHDYTNGFIAVTEINRLDYCHDCGKRIKYVEVE